MSGQAASGGLGARVKQLRENRDMTLATLAEEIDRDVAYLERLESGQFRPPVAELLILAEALKVDSLLLLSEGREPSDPERHQIAIQRRTDNYAYELLAPDKIQKFLKSFMITVEPNSTLEGPGYHHSGEEFHYVLKGELQVEVGDETHRLGKGEALYFNSEKVHKLSNPGQESCEVLVVLYTP